VLTQTDEKKTHFSVLQQHFYFILISNSFHIMFTFFKQESMLKIKGSATLTEDQPKHNYPLTAEASCYSVL